MFDFLLMIISPAVGIGVIGALAVALNNRRERRQQRAARRAERAEWDRQNPWPACRTCSKDLYIYVDCAICNAPLCLDCATCVGVKDWRCGEHASVTSPKEVA